MNPILIALLGVYLIPLFVATWRTSLLGLACQGFLMGIIAYRLGPPASPEAWLRLIDLWALRGLLAPFVIYRVLKAQDTPARNDVIPPNLLSWTIALGMVLVAFNLSERIVPPGQGQTLVAVATAGLELGFLVLASQSGPVSQMIGALRIENAIALFALGLHETPPVGVAIGEMLVFVGTIGLFGWYLRTLGLPAAETEGPTL